jgi:hypothetical protein
MEELTRHVLESTHMYPLAHSGCETCDNNVWDRNAGGYSCGARISWAMIVDQENQVDACSKVADQHPQCTECKCFRRSKLSPKAGKCFVQRSTSHPPVRHRIDFFMR